MTLEFFSISLNALPTLAILGLFIIAESALPFDLADPRRRMAKNFFLMLLGVAAMVFHLHSRDGVILDQRGAVVAVATLFGGLWTGLATAAAEAGYRLYVGGNGMLAGVAGIGGDFLLSVLVWRHVKWQSSEDAVSFMTLVMAGCAVGASEAGSLLMVPAFTENFIELLDTAIFLFLVQLLSTLLFGGLIGIQESRHRALVQMNHKAEALRRTLQQSVDALSSAMAYRDPSTEGHERRVAELAVAVGKELGFDESRLEGLRLAATVHDVGQLQIPAEILTRPRKLLKEEFELVKGHVEAGYQILKDIDFPWPIAEIVYQHHENYDGSGYPRGLSGAQILQEASIIRVCDALEAMLSHRPFRRAYDAEQVLQELQAGSGKDYDPFVVDACTRLFKERGFTFSTVKKSIRQ